MKPFFLFLALIGSGVVLGPLSHPIGFLGSLFREPHR